MADNVPVTPGTGTDIATDQVADTLEHVQLFKLAYATDGSRLLVPADGDGLAVKIQGVVSDAPETYQDDAVQPLSLTNQGRLRVSSVQADIEQVWGHTFDSPWPSDNPWEIEDLYV